MNGHIKRWAVWPATGVFLLASFQSTAFSKINPAKPPACVLDIDETLTDPAYQRRTVNKVPLLDARASLQRLESRGVAIFYVSARLIDRLDKTRWWLDHWRFPPGRGVYLRASPAENKLDFKMRVIKELQRNYHVLFGIGDRETDMKAYQRCGILGLQVKEPSDWLELDRSIQELVTEAGGEWPSDYDAKKRSLAATGRNRYFILEPGFRTVLEGNGERLTVTVLDETKVVAGVTTRVVEEQEEKEGKVVEISRNYLAICRCTGDVFYFGEDVNYYNTGQVVSHAGAWLAGEDNAIPSLLLPAQPATGMKYYQEAAPGKAMDRAEIVSLTETLKTSAGVFKNCLKTQETISLDPGGKECKTYAPGIGLIQDDNLLLSEYGFAGNSRGGS